MQRFLRDSQYGLPVEQLASALEERIDIIRRHFPPSVAAAYALPRTGGNGVLEWWTSQEGQVRAFSIASPAEQQALLQSYAAHQAQLADLAATLESQGLSRQAASVRSLLGSADTANLYSVEGHLLIVKHVEPSHHRAEPLPVAVEPATRRRLWPAIACALLLALVLALYLGFRFLRAVPSTKPAPTPEPTSAPSEPIWPAEIIFLLDTSSTMSQQYEANDLVRSVIASQNISAIAESLPETTDIHLIHYSEKRCARPVHRGPYPAAQRSEFLTQIEQVSNNGEAPLAISLQAAANAVDGVDRDALMFAFVGGPDTCGEDICAVAQAIHQDKPKLRINLVDLSGEKLVDRCISTITGGETYFWGSIDPDSERRVNLSEEIGKMLGDTTNAQ